MSIRDPESRFGKNIPDFLRNISRTEIVASSLTIGGLALLLPGCISTGEDRNPDIPQRPASEVQSFEKLSPDQKIRQLKEDYEEKFVAPRNFVRLEMDEFGKFTREETKRRQESGIEGPIEAAGAVYAQVGPGDNESYIEAKVSYVDENTVSLDASSLPDESLVEQDFFARVVLPGSPEDATGSISRLRTLPSEDPSVLLLQVPQTPEAMVPLATPSN